MDSLDISCIRDTRTGKYAKVPKVNEPTSLCLSLYFGCVFHYSLHLSVFVTNWGLVRDFKFISCASELSHLECRHISVVHGALNIC